MGDATGGAVFAAALTLTAGIRPGYACCYAAFVSFGRMFLWAHHLSDVAAGCLIGALSTLLLDAVLGAQNFGLRHLVADAATILPVYISRRRLRQAD